ncbi:MAG: hypothetical protein HYU27_00390 [Acidobacteria bacterium]|nr:hypothetical protein [Acidobacteriota bacterium]
MRAKTLFTVCFLVSLMMVMYAFAQEGHPLKGTWLGDWGPSKTDRNQVTVVLDWDGKAITGVINPGPDAILLTKAMLEPKGWIVHFEASMKDRSGKTTNYVIDGKIENLGLYNRSIAGTWNHDNVKGDFKITRQ